MNSVYQLASTWTDQTGKTFRLSDLRGTPVILTMFYTSCTYSCPITIALVKKMQNSLPKAKQSQTRFVLVSYDSERDTVEKLKSTATKFGLAEPTWLLIRGNAADTRELAVLLGLKYKQAAGGEISHSNEFMLLDSNGVILSRHVGLGADFQNFLNQIPVALASKPVRKSITSDYSRKP